MFWALIGAGVFTYGVIYLVALCLVDSDLNLAFLERFGKSISRIKGKVVFITGASSGIGEYTAYALAKHGVKLVLAARRRNELERVKRKCLELSNGSLIDSDVLVIAMDMCDLVSHKMHFQNAIRHFGHVDVLFNNAGRSQRAMWENIDITVDKDLFELNVFSVINLSRVALEHFNQRGEGHVAVTSSLAGVIGVAYSGSYTGAKHAIHGYMNSLRNEKMGKRITVSLFCPGPVFTNFLQESFTDKPGEKYGITTQPTDRRLTAERCGQLCAIGIANKIKEGWMAMFPLMPITYCAVYFPLIFHLGVKILGPEKMFKLRDSKAPQLSSVEVQHI